MNQAIKYAFKYPERTHICLCSKSVWPLVSLKFPLLEFENEVKIYAYSWLIRIRWPFYDCFYCWRYTFRQFLFIFIYCILAWKMDGKGPLCFVINVAIFSFFCINISVLYFITNIKKSMHTNYLIFLLSWKFNFFILFLHANILYIMSKAFKFRL